MLTHTYIHMHIHTHLPCPSQIPYPASLSSERLSLPYVVLNAFVFLCFLSFFLPFPPNCKHGSKGSFHFVWSWIIPNLFNGPCIQQTLNKFLNGWIGKWMYTLWQEPIRWVQSIARIASKSITRVVMKYWKKCHNIPRSLSKYISMEGIQSVNLSMQLHLPPMSSRSFHMHVINVPRDSELDTLHIYLGGH